MTNSTLIKMIDNTDLNKASKINDNYYLCKYNEYEYFIILCNEQKAGGVLNCGDDIHIIIKPEFQGNHLMSNFLHSKLIQKYWKNIKSCNLVPEAFKDRNDIIKKIHLARKAGLKIANMKQVLNYYNNIFIND